MNPKFIGEKMAVQHDYLHNEFKSAVMERGKRQRICRGVDACLCTPIPNRSCNHLDVTVLAICVAIILEPHVHIPSGFWSCYIYHKHQEGITIAQLLAYMIEVVGGQRDQKLSKGKFQSR